MAGVPENLEDEGEDLGGVTTADEESTASCPKCGSDSEWGASSWCPDCGYYPGVNEDAIPTSDTIVDELSGEEVSADEVGKKPLVPIWAQLVLGTFAAILVGSSVVSTYFHYYGGDRGFWSLSQLVLGLILLLTAQFWALVCAMKESNDVGLADMFVTPIEIWRYTFARLPAGNARVVMGVAGLTMAISSIGIIGGIDYESFFDTPIVAEREKQPDIVKRAMTAAMQNTKGDDLEEKGFEDSLNDFTDKVIDPTAALDMTMPSESEPLTCFIYGYMKDGRNDFGRYLLGATVMGKSIHVGEISAKDLTPTLRQKLAIILPSMATDEPAVESSFNGKWVKPSYSLQIEFDGWTLGGLLMNPKLAPEDEA